MTQEFSVKFWGVRGTISCAGPQYMRYGGNTSCLEVRAGGRTLIFDAGTGIRALGAQLLTCGQHEFDIFFTHSHLDHVVGLSVFAPMYDGRNTIRLSAGHLLPALTLMDAIKEFMKAPLYPVSVDIFAAVCRFNDFHAGDTLHPAPGVELRTAPLNHPNGATGYRIECGGKSICYITDTEHRGDGPDKAIVELCRGADVMVYDSTYTDAEYPKYKGWGHSTWQEGVRVADAAGVGTLAVFHHDPNHDDDAMDAIAREAAETRPGVNANGLARVVVAREGMTLAP